MLPDEGQVDGYVNSYFNPALAYLSSHHELTLPQLVRLVCYRASVSHSDLTLPKNGVLRIKCRRSFVPMKSDKVGSVGITLLNSIALIFPPLPFTTSNHLFSCTSSLSAVLDIQRHRWIYCRARRIVYHRKRKFFVSLSRVPNHVLFVCLLTFIVRFSLLRTT